MKNAMSRTIMRHAPVGNELDRKIRDASPDDEEGNTMGITKMTHSSSNDGVSTNLPLPEGMAMDKPMMTNSTSDDEGSANIPLKLDNSTDRTISSENLCITLPPLKSYHQAMERSVPMPKPKLKPHVCIEISKAEVYTNLQFHCQATERSMRTLEPQRSPCFEMSRAEVTTNLPLLEGMAMERPMMTHSTSDDESSANIPLPEGMAMERPMMTHSTSDDESSANIPLPEGMAMERPMMTHSTSDDEGSANIPFKLGNSRGRTISSENLCIMLKPQCSPCCMEISRAKVSTNLDDIAMDKPMMTNSTSDDESSANIPLKLDNSMYRQISPDHLYMLECADGLEMCREMSSKEYYTKKRSITSSMSDWPPKFTKIDLAILCFSAILFIFDMVSDWLLAASYFMDNKLWLFYVSAGFIFVPSVFSGILSIIWYIMEEKNNNHKNPVRVVFRVLFSFLQLGRTYRSVETLYYMVQGWRTNQPKKQTYLREKTVHYMQDSVILELLDGFLESALQLLLQLYLTVSIPIKMDLIRGGTLLLSLASTAWTHTSYYRTSRISKKGKKNVGYVGSAFYSLWRICEIGPRILLLSLCIHCFYPWVFFLIALHFMFMFIFFCFLNPKLSGICHYKFCNHLFLLLMSYIGIFCFINLKAGRTKIRAIIYYTIFYAENILMAALIIWYSTSGYVDLAGWTYSSLSFVPGGLFQFVFMFVFYTFFHPDRSN